MGIIRFIKRLFCKHPHWEHEVTEYAKPKYKHTKKNSGYFRLRYDIWETRRCGVCGKKLGKAKVKADLTQQQVEKRFGYYG